MADEIRKKQQEIYDKRVEIMKVRSEIEAAELAVEERHLRTLLVEKYKQLTELTQELKEMR